MDLQTAQDDKKHLQSGNCSPWKRRPPLCHPERSRGICSSADYSWKCCNLRLKNSSAYEQRQRPVAQSCPGEDAIHIQRFAHLVSESIHRFFALQVPWIEHGW